MGLSLCSPSNPKATQHEDLLSVEEFVDAVEVAYKRTSIRTSRGEKPHAFINMDIIQTILIDDDDDGTNVSFQRSSNRKGTGYVTKEEVDQLVDKGVQFADVTDEELADLQTQLSDGARRRVKDRKGTAFVTKAQLITALEEASDEEPDPNANSAPAPKRKGRKGTGFVSKKKLKKVVAILGEEE